MRKNLNNKYQPKQGEGILPSPFKLLFQYITNQSLPTIEKQLYHGEGTTTKEAIADGPSQTVPLEPSVLGLSGLVLALPAYHRRFLFRTVCDN